MMLELLHRQDPAGLTGTHRLNFYHFIVIYIASIV